MNRIARTTPLTRSAAILEPATAPWPGPGRKAVRVGGDEYSVRDDSSLREIREALAYFNLYTNRPGIEWVLARPAECDRLVNDYRMAQRLDR